MRGAGAEQGLAQILLRMWPALPYLGLGLWLSWPFLAYSGGVWLSDIEVNGENISRLFIASSIALAAVSLVAAGFNQRFFLLMQSRAFVLGAGLIGCLGSLAIILAGPYYLGQFMLLNPNPIFLSGAILTGLGSGVLLLRCGLLYSQLPPRRALLYAALSHLLLASVFYVVLGVPYWCPVPGGPPLAGIIAFLALLPLAAFVLTLSPLGFGQAWGSMSSVSELGGELRQLPSVFWKFIVMLLLFSTVASMMRAIIIEIHPVDVTLSSTSTMMLLRIVMAVTFIVVSVHARTRHLNFGKLFSLIAIVIVVAIALLPSFGVLDVNWNLIIGTASMVFEYILWCILAIIAYQKRISAIVIFGFGYGSFMLGNTLGWFAGVFGLTQIVDSPWISIFYLLLAGMVLIIALILFSERDFARLFSPISESELALESLMSIEVTSYDADRPDRPDRPDQPESSDKAHRRGHFSQTMDRLAAEKGLSPRESEVLRYLAMGRGSDFIAEQLSVSWNTARTHVHNVYVKLGVHSRADLMDYVDSLVTSDKDTHSK